jgi:peptidoglycan/LPS O-acetylase OafA/YrhL
LVILFQYPATLGTEGILQRLAAYFPKWFFITRIFWFPLGIVIGLHVSKFNEWLKNKKLIFLAVTLILIPVGMIEWEILYQFSGQEWVANRETLIDSVFALTLIFTILGMEIKYLAGIDKISILGTNSYGIFLSHAVFIVYSARLIYHFSPQLLAYQLLVVAVLFVVGLSGPLLLMTVINRTPFRWGYKYLFG